MINKVWANALNHKYLHGLVLQGALTEYIQEGPGQSILPYLKGPEQDNFMFP